MGRDINAQRRPANSSLRSSLSQFGEHKPDDPMTLRRLQESAKKELIAPHFERSRDGQLPSVPPPRPNSQGEARRQVSKNVNSPKAKKNLPTEFKCHGQFCDLQTVDPAPLQSSDDDRGSNRERALRIAKQVLSSNEMRQLSSSGKLLQLGVTRRDPLAYKSVSQKR